MPLRSRIPLTEQAATLQHRDCGKRTRKLSKRMWLLATCGRSCKNSKLMSCSHTTGGRRSGIEKQPIYESLPVKRPKRLSAALSYPFKVQARLAMGVVQFLTAGGLFIGQSKEFFAARWTKLAQAADAAQRGFYCL